MLVTDERLRYVFPLTEESLVIDAGGYTGEWAQTIHAAALCRVEVYEPIQRYAEAAARRLAGTKCRVHRAGLAARDGEATMTVCQEGSAVAQPEDPGENEIVRMEAPSWTGPVDLLKVNIEGGEYDLIEHLLDQGMMEPVRFLLIQWHRGIPDCDRRKEELTRRLSGTHSLLWQFPWVWEAWERKT
jgi:FkbM family methyltransferase